MDILVYAFIAVASICAAVSLLHVTIFMRRTELKIHLVFAIMAFSSAVATVLDIFMDKAPDAATYVLFLKSTNSVQVLLWISFAWFVRFYTENVRRWMISLISGIYVLSFVLNLYFPHGILFNHVDRLVQVSLPWNERIASAIGPSNPWRLLPDLAWLILLVYALDSCIQMGRMGNLRRAVFFGVSLYACLGIGYLHGTFIDLGILPPPSSWNLTFLALIVLMSGSLVDQVVRLPAIRQRLAAQETRYQSLVDHAGILVLGLDREGRINFVNPYFTELTGYADSEVTGRSLLDLIEPSEKEEVAARIDKALSGGDFVDQSYRALISKTGIPKMIHWSHVLLRGEAGAIRGTLSIGSDVTEIRKAQQDLADEKARMDVILSTLNTGLALLDPDLTVLWVNQTTRQAFTADDPVGKKCYRFAENRQEPCEGCGALQAIADGGIHETVRLNSTNKRWYQIISMPIKDPHGTVVNVLESLTDITDRVEAEERIRQSEQRYRIVSENTYDWEFWMGPDGRFRYVSPSCERITGYGPDEFLADHTLNERVTHPDDLESLRTHSSLEMHRRHGNLEYRIIDKDGKEIWIGHVCQPIFSEDGHFLGVRGSNRDITQIKLAEQQRDTAMQELSALKSQLEEENLYLREELMAQAGFEEVIGRSNVMLYLLERVKQVAGTDATVLIQGETGVGKELIAGAIHRASTRAGKAYIKLNCAALAPNLVENELFGHEAGAYTGAEKMRKGRFELADGGTLLLDEISELSTEVQAKLLRVLQEGQFERVGGNTTVTVNVRIIATTNRTLSEEVAQGRFRADLYYRLKVYPVTVPPLRKRKDDIGPLVWHFLDEINARVGKKINKIPKNVMDDLMSMHFPGNVRELKNLLEHAVITSSNGVLQLPSSAKAAALTDISSASPHNADDHRAPSSLLSLNQAQRDHIARVLDHTGGRIEGRNGAAEILQVKPSTLRYRMKILGISPKR